MPKHLRKMFREGVTGFLVYPIFWGFYASRGFVHSTWKQLVLDLVLSFVASYIMSCNLETAIEAVYRGYRCLKGE